MNAWTPRTAFQDTLLGDDEGSRIAWRLWAAGYARGVQSGTTAGYREAMADLLEMAGLVASWRTSRLTPHAELERRRTTYATPGKTAAQIRAECDASWGLPESEQR